MANQGFLACKMSYTPQITPCARRKCVHCGLDTRKELNSRLCCYAWYRFVNRRELEYLRKKAEKDYWNSTCGGNSVELSIWYRVMRAYIDAYTDKVISRKKCYKYGREDIDEAVRDGFVDKNKLGYCHVFWMVKKAILEKEYGLIWNTPQEMKPDTGFD